MNTALRKATYEDLLQVPDNLIAEILDGELITSPRLALAHALAAGGAELVRAEPFAAVAMDISQWWLEEEAATPEKP
jgi:hypothetical protein